MLKNDKVNFVIALILAIGLWVYVFVTDNQSMDTTIKNVPITIVNEDTLTDEGLVLLSVSDESISVSIKGDRGETGKIKKEDIRITFKPFSDDYFLLVSAAKSGNQIIRSPALGVPSVNFTDRGFFPLSIVKET